MEHTQDDVLSPDFSNHFQFFHGTTMQANTDNPLYAAEDPWTVAEETHEERQETFIPETTHFALELMASTVTGIKKKRRNTSDKWN